MSDWDSAPTDTAEGARSLLLTTFSPNAPISRQEVFAGRQAQLRELLDAIRQVGQHAVIYGDRGVGKTSLAMVGQEITRGGGYFAALITCDSTSTFTRIWKQAFREIKVVHGDGSEGDASYLLQEELLTPDDIRLAFKALSFNAPVVVFIDEFDTLASREDRQLFANLVKILSDHALHVTVVFVGVAGDVNHLIEDHASVQRVLAEVFMPRMDTEERIDIVKHGLQGAGMFATTVAAERISLLSQGMPTIVHRLGQQAGFKALERDSREVDVEDVDAAIEPVISRNMESISNVYDHATFTTRPGTLFKVIALACACAPADDKGFFTSGSIRRPLKIVAGKAYEIPAYSAHLNNFSTKRGPLLEKVGSERAYKYRFLNPLFQPYIVLRALKEGIIDHDTLATLTTVTAST